MTRGGAFFRHAVVLAGLAALMMLAGRVAADAASPLDTIFGGKAIASTNFEVKANAIANWKDMEDRFNKQQADCHPTDGCLEFKQLVDSLSGLSTHDQLVAVRRAEKAIVYTEDIKTSGKMDYWATPYETLSTKTGDTEDYAILAYYALRAAGMPAAALRVVAVRLRSLGNIGHAVLLVDTSPEPQILDNRIATPFPARLAQNEMTPALGVNENFWWVYLPGTAGQ